MESETLRNIRTMRQVKSSFEVARRQRIKTTDSLFKTPEEIEHLETIGLGNHQVAQILAKERARAAKFEASAERSRRKLLNSREKLAVIINRNRALTTLRHEIQHERDGRTKPISLAVSSRQPEKVKPGSLRGIELKY
jgi:hypothetical protein